MPTSSNKRVKSSSSGSESTPRPMTKKSKATPSVAVTDENVSAPSENVFTEDNVEEALVSLMRGERMTALIKSFVREAVSLMKAELKNIFEHRMDIIEGKFFDLNKSQDQASREIELLKAQLQQHTDNMDILRADIQRARCETEELEMYGRRNSIRIFGVEECTKSEDCVAIAREIFKQKLDIDVMEHEISRAHRVGKPNMDARFPKPGRPIILRFIRHDMKEKVVKQRRKLKGTRITISEDLTKLRADMVKLSDTLRC